MGSGRGWPLKCFFTNIFVWLIACFYLSVCWDMMTSENSKLQTPTVVACLTYCTIWTGRGMNLTQPSIDVQFD